MFRIKAHKIINEDGNETIVMRSGDSSKILRVIARFADAEFYQEQELRFVMKCKELVRDRLYSKHGKNWRKYEQPKLIQNSIISAYKRMQTSQP